MASNKEHLLQVACVNWFKYCYPNYRNNILSIPNGGHRFVSVAKKLKAEGQLSGASDLFIALPSSGYHGYFIELKIMPNKITPNQKAFSEVMLRSGYKFDLIYCFDDFRKLVTEYIKNIDI